MHDSIFALRMALGLLVFVVCFTGLQSPSYHISDCGLTESPTVRVVLVVQADKPTFLEFSFMRAFLSTIAGM